MTHTDPTEHTHSTEPTSTSNTTTKTKHYSRSTNTSPEPRTTATRSNDSHRCIPICGSGPPPGRPNAPRRVVDHAVDLYKIVSGSGWSSWC
jgi:hypothetical protein